MVPCLFLNLISFISMRRRNLFLRYFSDLAFVTSRLTYFVSNGLKFLRLQFLVLQQFLIGGINNCISFICYLQKSYISFLVQLYFQQMQNQHIFQIIHSVKNQKKNPNIVKGTNKLQYHNKPVQNQTEIIQNISSFYKNRLKQEILM